jgi:hypothetical protein
VLAHEAAHFLGDLRKTTIYSAFCKKFTRLCGIDADVILSREKRRVLDMGSYYPISSRAYEMPKI